MQASCAYYTLEINVVRILYTYDHTYTASYLPRNSNNMHNATPERRSMENAHHFQCQNNLEDFCKKPTMRMATKRQ